MVKKQPAVYLFIGSDTPSKDTALSELAQQTLAPDTRDFNFDVLHCHDREFSLKVLQEKLLYHAAAGVQRMVVLRDVESAKADVKKFLSAFIQAPPEGLILVLDAERGDPKDEFFRSLERHARVQRFREEAAPNTFALGRLIEARKTAQSLEMLHRLLDAGEKPERIMGGLRASWQRYPPEQPAVKKRMRLLLAADLQVKTGKIKPVFALERMGVALCGL